MYILNLNIHIYFQSPHPPSILPCTPNPCTPSSTHLHPPLYLSSLFLHPLRLKLTWNSSWKKSIHLISMLERWGNTNDSQTISSTTLKRFPYMAYPMCWPGLGGRVVVQGAGWLYVSVLGYMRSRWGDLDEARRLQTGIRCYCYCYYFLAKDNSSKPILYKIIFNFNFNIVNI